MSTTCNPFEGSQPCYFCFLMTQEKGSFVFGWVYLVAIIIFLCMTIRQIIKYKDKDNMINLVSAVYFLLVLWSIFCIIQIVFSQILFLIDTPQFWSKNKDFILCCSFLLFFIVFSQVFLLNTSIMMGSYNWHQNLLNYMFCSILQKPQNSDSFQENQKLQKSLQKKTLKVIAIYLPIRQVILLIWAVWMIQLSVSKNESNKYISGVLTYYMAFVDSILLSMMFIVQTYTLNKNEIVRQKMDPVDFKRLIYKFFGIIICTLVETLILILKNPQVKSPLSYQIMKTQCVFRQQEFNFWILFILIIQALFINLFPQIALLRLYTQEEKSDQNNETLLEAQD